MVDECPNFTFGIIPSFTFIRNPTLFLHNPFISFDKIKTPKNSNHLIHSMNNVNIKEKILKFFKFKAQCLSFTPFCPYFQSTTDSTVTHLREAPPPSHHLSASSSSLVLLTLFQRCVCLGVFSHSHTSEYEQTKNKYNSNDDSKKKNNYPKKIPNSHVLFSVLCQNFESHPSAHFWQACLK